MQVCADDVVDRLVGGADPAVRLREGRRPNAVDPYSFRYENGAGSSSPAAVRIARSRSYSRSSRGGVPVFSRPSSRPSRARQPESPRRSGFADAAAFGLRSPVCMRARRNVPVVTITARQVKLRSVGEQDADAPPRDALASRLSSSFDVRDFAGDDVEVGARRQQPLHFARVLVLVACAAVPTRRGPCCG